MMGDAGVRACYLITGGQADTASEASGVLEQACRGLDWPWLLLVMPAFNGQLLNGGVGAANGTSVLLRPSCGGSGSWHSVGHDQIGSHGTTSTVVGQAAPCTATAWCCWSCCCTTSSWPWYVDVAHNQRSCRHTSIGQPRLDQAAGWLMSVVRHRSAA